MRTIWHIVCAVGLCVVVLAIAVVLSPLLFALIIYDMVGHPDTWGG